MSAAIKTIRKQGESIYRDKGSKHLGLAVRVDNREEVSEIVAKLRNDHPKANHVCYAYRIQGDHLEEYANDDGEPRNSAGPPILGQIVRNDLLNTAVFVVRYFGGTKLGVAGLINAYKTAASEAFLDAEFETLEPRSKIRITFKYEVIDQIMSFINKHQLQVLSEDHSENGSIDLSVKQEEVVDLRKDLEVIGALTFDEI